jgi:tetratricopeptide (TPR) repeat protein
LGWQRRSLLARLVTGRLVKLWAMWSDDLEITDIAHQYYFYEVGYYQQRRDGVFATARDLTMECLLNLRDMVRADGAELMVTILPSQNQVDKKKWLRTLAKLSIDERGLGALDFNYPNSLVVDLCKEQDIPLLDLTPVFANKSEVEDLYLTKFDDGHFSRLGHRVTAKYLATFIQRESGMGTDDGRREYRWGQQLLKNGAVAQAAELFSQAAAKNSQIEAYEIAIGDVSVVQHDWLRAISAYQRAVDINPQARLAWEKIASAAAAIGDGEASLHAWSQALNLHASWWPYTEKIIELYEKMGRRQEAAILKNKVEQLFVSPLPIRKFWWNEHIAAGTASAAERSWKHAEREFLRASRFISDEPVTYYNLGLVYERMQRLEQAVDSYKHALSLARDFTPAAQRLRELGR